MKVKWPPPWRVVVKWPWQGRREQQKMIKEELERGKKQLQELCFAVKAETVPDLQEILCCMVLSECVYKVHCSLFVVEIEIVFRAVENVCFWK